MDSDNRNTFAIKTFLKDYLDLRKDKDNETGNCRFHP